MSLYAVSDIHSFYDPLMTSLTEAGFFKSKKNRLIVLGDALDRGADARKVVDFLLDLHKQGRLIYVTGNHEDLLYQCMQAISHGEVYDIACGMSHHYTNGTFDTLLQLAEMNAHDAVCYPHDLVRRVRQSVYYRELLPTCVDYYETATHVFCHGWIPVHTEGYKPFVTYSALPDWREASEVEWQKARWFNGMEMACRRRIKDADKVVVCGHWHTSWGHALIHKDGTEWGKDAVFTPFYDEGIIAIDACTAVSKTVNCLVFEES